MAADNAVTRLVAEVVREFCAGHGGDESRAEHWRELAMAAKREHEAMRDAIRTKEREHSDACAELDEQRARAESAELGCSIAYQREPTQAEGDAHEAGEPDHAKGECFVPMGGWTGRRCRVCSRWTWGGPTACLECVRREEWDAASAERIAGLEGRIAAAHEVLALSGCYCDCDHDHEGHDDDCERCLGCKIEAALAAKGK